MAATGRHKPVLGSSQVKVMLSSESCGRLNARRMASVNCRYPSAPGVVQEDVVAWGRVTTSWRQRHTDAACTRGRSLGQTRTNSPAPGGTSSRQLLATHSTATARHAPTATHTHLAPRGSCRSCCQSLRSSPPALRTRPARWGSARASSLAARSRKSRSSARACCWCVCVCVCVCVCCACCVCEHVLSCTAAA
jgi:hypothetical protein